MKKSAMLSILLAALLLTGCGSPTLAEDTGKTDESASETTAVPGRWDGVDFGEKKVTALIRSEFAYEFDVESETAYKELLKNLLENYK